MIPAQAVEAATDALIASKLGDHAGINGEEFIEAARLALEAAAPHMLAGAKADALIEAAEVAERGEGGGHDSGECDDWGAWLRARATELRPTP